jgi:hypothetical protein
MDAKAKMIQMIEKLGGNEDQILHLIEKLTEQVRADMKDDILIELKAMGRDETLSDAADMIKSNF